MSADATLEKIESIKVHPNADKLELAEILGYTCVIQKGQFSPGDLVVYIRSDSVLPDSEWAVNYKQYAPNRVRIIKLRGEYSEGIVMPVTEFLNVIGSTHNTYGIGADLSGILNIKHYEPKLPQNIDAKRLMPYLIPKTDEERWENIVTLLPIGEYCDITLKIDGTSATYFYKLGDESVGIASRSLEIKPESNNNYTKIFQKYDIGNKLKLFCEEHNISIAIRGEIYGNGIQGYNHNPHSKIELDFAMYSVYLIDQRRYARLTDPFYFKLVAGIMGIPTVPIIEESVILTKGKIQYYSSETDSLNGKAFEGVVVQYQFGSFKILNKNYDSKK